LTITNFEDNFGEHSVIIMLTDTKNASKSYTTTINVVKESINEIHFDLDLIAYYPFESKISMNEVIEDNILSNLSLNFKSQNNSANPKWLQYNQESQILIVSNYSRSLVGTHLISIFWIIVCLFFFLNTKMSKMSILSFKYYKLKSYLLGNSGCMDT
jgi:hypothetical protein